MRIYGGPSGGNILAATKFPTYKPTYYNVPVPRYIYLAGPIVGCNKEEANDWRQYVSKSLAAGIIGISPLRCEPIVGDKYTQIYDDPKFGTAKAIGSKNFFDSINCDMTLAYLPKPLEGRHQSYGTILEIGWVSGKQKPVIVVSDDLDILHHPVIDKCASWLLTNLEDAIEVINGVLGGYTGGKNV